MIIERSASDALRASIAGLPEDAAQDLAERWRKRTYNEVASELFEIAGLASAAAFLKQLDVLALSHEELSREFRTLVQQVNDSPLWSERSHAACESLRCARRAVRSYDDRWWREPQPRERAASAAFALIFQTLFIDQANAESESPKQAPRAQAALDRVRREIAERTGNTASSG